MKKGIAVKSLAGMLILCAAATAHARQAMMVDLPYRNLQPVSAGTLDTTRVESAIRDGAISAGWNVMSEAPGQIVLERWVSQHRMEVNVSFDDHGYDIDYRASDVLNYEIKRGVPYIHPRYNEWVRELSDTMARSPVLDPALPALPKRDVAVNMKTGPVTRLALVGPVPMNHRLIVREGYHVSTDIQRCPFHTEYSELVASQSGGRVVVSDKPTSKLPGYSLESTLMNVHTIGGGSVTGPKFAVVETNLYKDGQLIGNIRQRRHTLKSWTGCGALERIGRVLAQDTVEWLRGGQFQVHDYRSYDEAADAEAAAEAGAADATEAAGGASATGAEAAP